MMLIEVSPCEVLLVTGGWQGGWYPMLSTELLVPGSGSWRLTGLLHRPMEGVGVATVDNRVLDRCVVEELSTGLGEILQSEHQ